jgi:hypothetical protein
MSGLAAQVAVQPALVAMRQHLILLGDYQVANILVAVQLHGIFQGVVRLHGLRLMDGALNGVVVVVVGLELIQTQIHTAAVIRYTVAVVADVEECKHPMALAMQEEMVEALVPTILQMVPQVEPLVKTEVTALIQ